MRRLELIGEICWLAGHRRKLPGRQNFTKEELVKVFDFMKDKLEPPTNPGSKKRKAKRRYGGKK